MQPRLPFHPSQHLQKKPVMVNLPPFLVVELIVLLVAGAVVLIIFRQLKHKESKQEALSSSKEATSPAKDIKDFPHGLALLQPSPKQVRQFRGHPGRIHQLQNK